MSWYKSSSGKGDGGKTVSGFATKMAKKGETFVSLPPMDDFAPHYDDGITTPLPLSDLVSRKYDYYREAIENTASRTDANPYNSATVKQYTFETDFNVVNLLGIRGWRDGRHIRNFKNLFNDTIVALWQGCPLPHPSTHADDASCTCQRKKNVLEVRATVEPGCYDFWDNKIGDGYLLQGQYIYKVGVHAGKRTALRCANKQFKVWRDISKTGIRDWGGVTSVIEEGNFGQNIHSSSSSKREPYPVGNWSTGCQVIRGDMKSEEVRSILSLFTNKIKWHLHKDKSYTHNFVQSTHPLIHPNPDLIRYTLIDQGNMPPGVGVPPAPINRDQTFTDSTCVTTTGSSTITCSRSTQIEVGQVVSGDGIPVDTYVLNVLNPGEVTSFQISNDATDSGLTTLLFDRIGISTEQFTRNEEVLETAEFLATNKNTGANTPSGVKSYKNWTYNHDGGINTSKKKIDGEHFILKLIERLAQSEGDVVSSTLEENILMTTISANLTDLDTYVEDDTQGNHEKTKGIVYALEQAGWGVEIENPADAIPGDLIRYWTKSPQSDNWGGNTGVIIQSGRDGPEGTSVLDKKICFEYWSSCPTLRGKSSGGTGKGEVSLFDPTTKCYIVRWSGTGGV